MQNKQSRPKIPVNASARTWAAFWRLSLRTVYKWLSADPPAPLHDPEALAHWCARSAFNRPVKFRQRLAELRHRDGAGSTPGGNSDWQAFEQARAGRERDHKADQEELLCFRDFAVFKLAKAHATKDEAAVRIYSDLHIKYERAIRENKLADLKLGIDEGELLPRKVAEAWLFAWGFWSMREVDLRLDAICAALAGLAKDVTAEQFRKVLQSELLSAKLLVPFAKATKYAAGTGLPEWAVAKARDVIDDLLENGAQEFDSEFFGNGSEPAQSIPPSPDAIQPLSPPEPI